MDPRIRTRLIMFFAALVALGLAIWGLVYFLSLQSVTINYESPVESVELFAAAKPDTTLTKGKAIKTLASGETYHLQQGSYVLHPVGGKIITDNIILTVGSEPVSQTIAPDYSTAYLKELLSPQQAAINQAIAASNAQLTKLYKINQGRLYERGDWYGTTLSYIGTDTLSRDTLRLIVHKQNGVWAVVTKSQIVLRASDYPDVPHDVITKVNAVDIGQPTAPGYKP